MPRYNKYCPNYEERYPSIEKRPDILSVLGKGDRKMGYTEL